MTSCPVDRRRSPWVHGLLRGCCGVFTSHPCAFGSAVLFRKAKLPCPRGRITSVKVYLEPSWPSTPALLCCCPRAACIVPLSPSPSQSSGVPVVSSAVLKRMHRWISRVLLQQDSPGTLDHLAFLIIIVLFWCAVQWSVQVHTLHRPFGNWWSVFSRIRVIQTSCTCRLKSCNPPALCSHCSQCMSVAPQSHTSKFTDTEINLHTLPCSLSASSALLAMKIHIKNWASLLLSSYIARSSTRFPSTELSFSLLPPLQLVRFFFWFYLWLPQWKSLYFFWF